MLVNLKKNWFDPAASLREVRNNPHDLPDDWEKILPKTAEIVDVPVEKAPAKSAEKK